ncbi:MAG TPA: transglycosylase SLT domain-containing protein [Myxococcales bacterium]|nr:transglycosylase SLT domain-containing protein [Myxococcales bacterium]
MIRIQHLSGSLKGQTSASGKTTVRIGRATDCDVRFDAAKDPKVSSHHAEFLYEDGQWFVVDIGSTNGTIIEGQKVSKQRLRQGEEVQIGAGGPLVRVEFDAADGAGGSMRTEIVSPDALQKYLKQKPTQRIDATQEMAAMSNDLKASADTETARLAELAAKRVGEERKKSGGQSSGKTMMIMANTFKEVNAQAKTKTRKRWVKVVAIVGGTAAVVVLGLSVVIWVQQKEIQDLVRKKQGLDKQIAAIQRQMEEETEPTKLIELEEQLSSLSANAQQTVSAVGKADKEAAAALANSGDELDHQIREILGKFDASTYVVPPIFKESLQAQIDELKGSSNLKYIYRRKMKYWPMIQREFSALGLPEEMAYIAWAETQFDPKAKNPSGAAGMWQLMPAVAENFNLRVEKQNDERYDPDKETRAAARYLANLLAEYGSDSFMLAMASYNRGEAGVRRVLHQIAQEPGGFRKEKRDFWHLYRLKKLPEETREYVPRVLAAAIVSRNAKKLGLEGPATDE